MSRRSSLLASLAVLVATSTACSSGGDRIAQRSELVVGGSTDGTDTGVVAVSLLSNPSSLCSGALIAPNLVLTARHCVAPSPDSIDCTTSQFGATTTARDVVIATDTSITATTPWYRSQEVRTPTNPSVCGNDVALVILSNELPASIGRPLIPRIDLAPAPGEFVTVAGYGVTAPDNVATAGIRRDRTGVQVVCNGDACGAGVAASEFEMSEGTCSGDSGGPAIDAQGRVMGITTRGDVDCLMGVDSSVSAWSAFIRTAGTDAATGVGAVPPYWASTGSSAPPPDGGTSSPADAGSIDTTNIEAGVTPAPLPTANTQRACSGPSDCFANEACYSENREPPGVCVPKCSATSHCASGRTCDSDLHVCLTTPGGSSGCAVRPVSGSHAPPAALLTAGVAAAIGFSLRRRGAARSTRTTA